MMRLLPATRRNPVAGRQRNAETSGENNENPLSAYLVGLAISFALPTLAQQTNTRDPQLRQQLLGSLKN